MEDAKHKGDQRDEDDEELQTGNVEHDDEEDLLLLQAGHTFRVLLLVVIV